MSINLLCEWSKLRQICLKVIFKILLIGFDAEKNYNFNSGYFKDMCDSAMGRLLIVDFGDIFLNKTEIQSFLCNLHLKLIVGG